MKVHPELSAITYLSSVKPDSLAPGGWAPTQMCSMDETQARKNLKHGGLHNTRTINAERICRVYPQGRRIASDNMDACEYATYLAAGFQMVALNMQTADEATQYQHAFFEQNGGCGYVLPRPLAPPGRGMALEVRLMGAWHLPKPDEGRVDEADPPPWRGIYPKLDTPEAIPAARDADDIIVTLSVVGAGFVMRRTSSQRLPKSRRGSAEPRAGAAASTTAASAGAAPSAFRPARRAGLARPPRRPPRQLPPATRRRRRRRLCLHSTATCGARRWCTATASLRRGTAATTAARRPCCSRRNPVAALRICVYACRTAPYAHKQMQAPRTLPSVDALKEKMLSEHKPQLIATATLPFATLAGGVRSVQLRHPRGEPIALCKMLVDVSSLPNVTVPTLPTFDASEPSVEPSVEQPTLASKLLRRASLGKVMGKSKPDLLKGRARRPSAVSSTASDRPLETCGSRAGLARLCAKRRRTVARTAAAVAARCRAAGRPWSIPTARGAIVAALCRASAPTPTLKSRRRGSRLRRACASWRRPMGASPRRPARRRAARHVVRAAVR